MGHFTLARSVVETTLLGPDLNVQFGRGYIIQSIGAAVFTPNGFVDERALQSRSPRRVLLDLLSETLIGQRWRFQYSIRICDFGGPIEVGL